MAREKKCFTPIELVRVWLRQSQDEGHAPGDRFYFTGDTIYSYGSHFPIARIFNAPNGEEVILFTTRTYSQTTSKHVWETERACNKSHRKIIRCHQPSDGLYRELNLSRFKSDMDAEAAKHAKARKWETEHKYASHIRYHANRAREYCAIMCIPAPVWALLPDDIEQGEPLRAALLIHSEEKGEHYAI